MELKSRRLLLLLKIWQNLLKLISKGTISGKIAKKVFADMWKDGGGAEEIVRVKGLTQISDTGELKGLVAAVIAEHPPGCCRLQGREEESCGGSCRADYESNKRTGQSAGG